MCQVRIIRKRQNYSAIDEINDRTKLVGTRKSERHIAKTSDAEMKKHREIRKLLKISEYKEYLERERIRSKIRKIDAVKRIWILITK